MDVSEDPYAFARLLLEIRGAAGLSRAEVARRIGVTPGTLKQYEYGRRGRYAAVRALHIDRPASFRAWGVNALAFWRGFPPTIWISAEVIVNGKKALGNVYPQMRGPVQSSTAFLAFSESWIK